MLSRFVFTPFLFIICVYFQSLCVAEDYSTLTFTPEPTIENAISTILFTKQNSLLSRSNFEYRADEVDALYKITNNKPLWLTTPQAEKNITDVLALLLNANSQGLNPDEYSANFLQQKFAFVQLLKPDSYADLALYDTALTISLVRYLHDIHYGRVNPHSLNFKVKLRTKKTLDLPQIIQTALNESTVSQLALKSEPTFPQYQKLRSALAAYKENAIAPKLDEKSHKKTNKVLNHGERILKIELAMERMRWLPEMNAPQSIIVNIPAFQLWGVNSSGQTSDAPLNLNVVVGKADKAQTPIIMAQMNSVEFMPYWNVPPSILKKEILPKIAHNPGYLAGQNMEVVSLKNGGMRVRQRPGGKNALGRLKFIFPNPDGVYLHDTPSKALFGRERRDFSHGCVRVKNPNELAKFVFTSQENWSPEKLDSMLQSDQHRQVSLNNKIPVLFFYSTAFYEQGDKLTFYNDIYGHDSALIAALLKVNDLPDSAFIATEKPIELQQNPEFDPEIFLTPVSKDEPLSP
jgi:murein L,D-transpeptidase YcbB/YkuD